MAKFLRDSWPQLTGIVRFAAIAVCLDLDWVIHNSALASKHYNICKRKMHKKVWENILCNFVPSDHIGAVL